MSPEAPRLHPGTGVNEERPHRSIEEMNAMEVLTTEEAEPPSLFQTVSGLLDIAETRQNEGHGPSPRMIMQTAVRI